MGLDRILLSMRTSWAGAASAQSACAISVQRLAALLQANARAALQHHELTFFEFEVLCVLRASPPPHELIPSLLYDAILISSGGLTKVLKSLERRGLIARVVRPGDGRRRPIALTAKGRRLVEKAMGSVQKADRLRFNASWLNEDDYEQLAGLAAKLVRAFEAKF